MAAMEVVDLCIRTGLHLPEFDRALLLDRIESLNEQISLLPLPTVLTLREPYSPRCNCLHRIPNEPHPFQAQTPNSDRPSAHCLRYSQRGCESRAGETCLRASRST